MGNNSLLSLTTNGQESGGGKRLFVFINKTFIAGACFRFMLEIKYFRETPDLVRKSEERRGHVVEAVDRVIKFDKKWRSATKKLEKLKHRRNVVSEEINVAKKAGKSIKTKVAAMKKVAADIKELEEKVDNYFAEREKTRKFIGNILHKSVPKGGNEWANQTIKRVGKKPKFKFPARDHIEIGKICDLFEFETAARISGARFFYLKNEAFILSLALQRFAVDYLLKQGFSMHWTPLMMNRESLAGGVNVSEFKDTIYKIEGQDLYLIGTSEHPLIALSKDKLYSEKEFPLKIGATTPCFRMEMGAHGRDDKGIFRVHQFNKTEQVVICRPENSERYFKELQRNTEKIFEALRIPFRVVNICTGDLGNKQHLQYDIEGWMPGQADGKGRYRELGSCSNCLSYQAEMLGTKYANKDGEKLFVHMLNNTAITDRTIIAILENFQQKDGSVKIPRALWKYTGFKKIKVKK